MEKKPWEKPGSVEGPGTCFRKEVKGAFHPLQHKSLLKVDHICSRNVK